MNPVDRNPETASLRKYDLIIIGGGIYGAMLALEASRRKLASLLLERDDFGAHTSFNSQRIIHGGLRYLQNLDLHRFRESVSERHWFLKHFPDFVHPLPCLMPLYGEGMRKLPVLRAVLLMNDILSRNRNRGVLPQSRLPNGRVISPSETRRIFPGVDKDGLKGGGIWFDACIPDSQCLLMEIIRMACGSGASALNYVETVALLRAGRRVSGVKALDRETGSSFDFQADVVVNAAGPWSRELARIFHQDNVELFRPSLAFNLLFNRQAISDHALAVAPKKPGAQTYFLVPWKGKIFAGTGHYPWLKDTQTPVTPSMPQISEFIADLNHAVPGLCLRTREILHTFAGLLPAAETGTKRLAVREVIINHSSNMGLQGLWSISGVKFTTSRRVAEKTLNRIFPGKALLPTIARSFQGKSDSGWGDFGQELSPDDWERLKDLAAKTAALHPDDLIFRRTTLWEDPRRVKKIRPLVREYLNMDGGQCTKKEI